MGKTERPKPVLSGGEVFTRRMGQYFGSPEVNYGWFGELVGKAAVLGADTVLGSLLLSVKM